MVRRIKEQEPARPSIRIRSSETLQKLASVRRTEPAQLSAEVEGELDWIVMRCLEKDRSRRYEGASALARDVQRYLSNEPVDACPPTLGYRMRKAYSKHRSAVWTAGSLAIVLLVATCVSSYLAVAARRAERAANEHRLEAQNNARQAHENGQLAQDRMEEISAAQRELALSTYAASMRLAYHEMENRNAGTVQRLLDDAPEELRGWEWHYLNRSIQSERLRLPGHQGRNRVAVYSPDGTKILTANQERIACLWDANTGELLRLFDSATAAISDASFDSEGNRILIASGYFPNEKGGLQVLDAPIRRDTAFNTPSI